GALNVLRCEIPYSITSSACTSNVSGIVSPSAFAVLRLTASSTRSPVRGGPLFGCFDQRLDDTRIDTLRDQTIGTRAVVPFVHEGLPLEIFQYPSEGMVILARRI